MEKVRAFCKKNKVYITAFLIPTLIMLAIFIGRRIFPFGNRSFLNIDMYHQYFPFLTEFYHMMKEGDSLYYSWNTGIGSNFTALFAYYLASPINWLAFFCPESILMEFMSYLVIIKIGLCGFTASYYLSKKFQTKNMSLAIFGSFYALSGYMAAYNWNVMWLDCIVLAPIIILGLEALVNEGKYKLYTISLALAIFSNYYICIMICIYLVLYFLFVLLPEAKHKIKSCLHFGIFSLLAGGMGSLLLIPELCALQLSKFTATTFPTTVKTYFSVFDMLARHLHTVAIETGLDHWPNIFCSMVVFLLFPMYLFCKQIPIQKKIGRLALLLFLLISFSTNALNFIWHGFNYPDSLPCRQSFLYILLVITLCYEAFTHIKEIPLSTLTGSFAGACGFILLCEKFITDEAFTGWTYILSGCFLALYLYILYQVKIREQLPRLFPLLVLMIVSLELGSNTFITSCSTVSRTSYFKNYDTYHLLQQRQSREDVGEYYRYEKLNRVTNNDSMLQDFPSSTLFSSTTNGLVNAFYEHYGLKTSKVFYSYEGATPLTSALLSTKYFYNDEEMPENTLYRKIDEANGLYLYEYTYSLPLGFFIAPEEKNEAVLIEDQATALGVIDEDKALEEDDSTDEMEDSLNPFERQNLLAIRLGAYDNLFERINHTPNGSKATITVPYDTHVYVYCDTKKHAEVTVTINGEEEIFKKMKNKRILSLGYHKEGTTIYLEGDTDNSLPLYAYSMSEPVLADITGILNTATFTMEDFYSDDFTGSITAPEDGHVIFSIPYDPGFTIWVDGTKTEPKLFEEMMIAVPVSSGEHTIRFSYYPQGLNAGYAVSIISILIFVSIVQYPNIKEKLQKRK